MPRPSVGFKDEASANEVERWISLQKSLGRSVKRHHEVLTTAGATLRSTSTADKLKKDVQAPRAVTFAATPRESPPKRPASRQKPQATTKPKISARPKSSTRIPPTLACEVARARMGVDPVTKKPRTAMYGGLKGFRSTNTEAYDAAHDPGNRELLKPALAIANPKPAESQTRSRHAEILHGDEQHRDWWRVNCLQSTRQFYDKPVEAAASKRPGAAEEEKTKRENFVASAVGSRLYYGDLLDDDGVRKVDKTLAELPVEQADAMIATLRDLHAGTATARQRTKSTAATHFNQGYVPTAFDTRRRLETAKRSRQQKGGTGESSEVTQARLKRKLERARTEAEDITAAKRKEEIRRDVGRAGLHAGVNCDLTKRRKLIGPTDGSIKMGSDFESVSVPRFASSYHEKQCGHMPEIVSQNRQGGHKVKYVEYSTMPFGEGLGVGRKHLEDKNETGDRVIGMWRNKPSTIAVESNVTNNGPERLYPIPGYLTKRTVDQSKGKFDASTTSRRAFVPKTNEFGEQRAAEVRALSKVNKTKRSQSTVPLGNKGITDHLRHRMTSSYVSDFVETHERRVLSAMEENKFEPI